MHPIWLNKISLVFCGIYLSVAALFFVLMSLSANPKAAYMWGQFAGAPALALLSWTGTIDSAMSQFPWLNTYPAVAVLSVLICYSAGVFFGALQYAFRGNR